MVNIERILLDPRDDLLGCLSESELVLYLSVNGLKSIDRVLYIHLVCVIVLEHVMCKVVGQLQAQHVVLERNKIHVDLRYLFFLEKFVFVKELIALDGSPRHKEDVDLFVI